MSSLYSNYWKVIETPVEDGIDNTTKDTIEEIKDKIDELLLKQLTKLQHKTFKLVCKEIVIKHNSTHIGLIRTQIINCVKHIQPLNTTLDVARVLEDSGIAKAIGSTYFYLQFNIIFSW